MLESLDGVKALGYQIRAALESDDLDAFGGLLHEHWELKKRRCGSISSVELDEWYDLGRRNGALGGKVVGTGGGGFLLFYSPASQRARLRAAMTGVGLREMPFDFDRFGAKVLVNL